VLSWPWLTSRVLTTDQPALLWMSRAAETAGLTRAERSSHELSGDLRRVSIGGSDLCLGFKSRTTQHPRPWGPASRPWPSTLYSATDLLTVFQARTSLDLGAYEAFPSRVVERDSSPRAVLHAVRLEAPKCSGCSYKDLNIPRVRFLPRCGLDAVGDRCSLDLLPLRGFPPAAWAPCFHRASSHGLLHTAASKSYPKKGPPSTVRLLSRVSKNCGMV